MKIGELFIALGFKTDNKKLSNFSKGVSSLRKNMLLTTGAFVGAIFIIDNFIEKTLKGVIALKNLNQQTGLSTQSIQKWQQAGQLANLSLTTEEISNSVAKLQNNIAEIRRGQGNIAPFQLLGIDIGGKNAFQILENIRNSIEGIDDATATNLIKKLGLDARFISLLRLSREEFEKLGKNIFLSKKQQSNILKLGRSFKILTLRLKALKDQAVAKITPELEKLINKFFKWIDQNGKRVVETIESFGRGFNNFTMAIGNAFDLLVKFVEKTMGFENGIKAVATAFALISLSFSPFLVGLTLIIALLDDIRVWSLGGKSLFGGFYDLIDGLIKRIEKLKESFNKLNFVKKFKEGSKDSNFLKLTKTILKESFSNPLGGVKAGSVMLAGGAISLINSIKENLTFDKKDKRNNITNNVRIEVVGTGDVNKDIINSVEELLNAQTSLNNGGI